MSSSSKCFAQ